MTPETGSIFLEDLDRIDVSIFHPDQGVVGASWHVDLLVSGPLDDNGFVQDFSQLKKDVKASLKGTIDHALIIPADAEDVRIHQDEDEIRVWLTDRSRPKHFVWEYQAPRAAVLAVGGEVVTREAVVAAIESRLRETIKGDLTRISVNLRDELAAETQAFFSYTHGITGHQGLCQRLLHGHRSQLKVLVDGKRRPDLEHELVRDVLGPSVHIGARWQLQSEGVEPYHRSRECRPVRLGYKGTLGSYLAVVPSDRFLLIDGETSIENLTLFLAKAVKHDFRDRDVEVYCYEGIGKGSVVRL